MLKSHRRLVYLILVIPTVVLASAFGYMLLMAALEGEPRGFWQSLEWAAETLSTTGFGADSEWHHPVTILFVIAVQFVGVCLVFLVVPVYLIPFLEERFEVRLPDAMPDVREHVLIFRYGPAVVTLIEELEKAGHPFVVVEVSESAARAVEQRGRPVVYGSLEDGVLERAALRHARALVANGEDDENANAVLAARESGYTGDVFCVVEEPAHARALTLAGATQVFTPRHILGAALAAHASDRIDPATAGVRVLDGRLQVREVRVAPGSELAGQTLAAARVGERTSATVLGLWIAGVLDAAPRPDTVLMEGSMAIVAGDSDAIGAFSTLAGVEARPRGRFVVAGAGEVGARVVELLRRAGEEVAVVDRWPGPGVDVVGDALDETVLTDLGVDKARAIVLALDTDSSTLFATVILGDLAPEVPVIARVNRAENIGRIFQAGAQFALSISQVSGRMLAFHLLGEDAVELHPRLKLLKVSAEGLVGSHPATLGVRERTGCSIVAVNRGGEIIAQLDSDFRFEVDDSVYVCGSMGATRRFLELFPQ